MVGHVGLIVRAVGYGRSGVEGATSAGGGAVGYGRELPSALMPRY